MTTTLAPGFVIPITGDLFVDGMAQALSAEDYPGYTLAKMLPEVQEKYLRLARAAIAYATLHYIPRPYEDRFA
ncbi:MAG: hypothetical protein DLM70_18355 [Chloroflexi bacterium]|nr:MAG: hypothetical protein DLM70_18355 [Chloroflexota bacterium]